MLRSHMQSAHFLAEVKESLAPDAAMISRVWARVARSADPLRHLSLWERLLGSLPPAEDLRQIIWLRLSEKLAFAEAKMSRQPVLFSRSLKWVAAFAIVALAVRISPVLFLAPQTVAVSSVTLFPRKGNVEMLLGSFWQPVKGELALQYPMRIQTQSGEATIIVHDDAVFRLAPGTRVALLDLSNRPQDTLQESTVALEEGQLWVLGLVPKHVRGITVVTAHGRVEIHEGSVSIRHENDGVTVQVLNRSAAVSRHGRHLPLVVGDQTVLRSSGELVATKMRASEFQSPWVALNLNHDAAHQREIAQFQQERRAATAGILPGSALYPVKRLAESVDVLLSFSEEERARKMITHANTRFDEAAALLLTGGAATEARSALDEYKTTLLQVASGSGGSPVVQSLLEKEVVQAGAAAVSAALPGDDAYALKQAVGETIAALPMVDSTNVEAETLLDHLVAAKREAEEGNTALAKEKLDELADSLASLETTGILVLVSPEVRDEAKAVAEQVVAAVEGSALSGEGPSIGIGLTLGAPPKETVEPEHGARTIAIRPLSPEQVAEKAQEIRGRIFVFGTKKSQYDALEDQLRIIAENPSRGSLLRELSIVLPRNGLAQRVLREIRTVNKEVELEVTAAEE